MPLRLQNQRLGLVAAVAIAAVGQKPVLDNHLVGLFLRELQSAVARDDRAAVSALVRYPLTVFAGSVRIPIADQASLLQNYDVVFSPAVKARIAQPARGPSASGTSVAIAAGAASIGDGVVQIEPVGDQLKITRITVPLASASAERAAVVNRGAGRTAERISLSVGSIQRAGALAPGGRNSYLLAATKNQLLEVHINGVSGRDIVARIVNVKSRTPIDSRVHDGVRTWIGRIPEDGDYRIEVVRRAPGTAELPYVMIVSMR